MKISISSFTDPIFCNVRETIIDISFSAKDALEAATLKIFDSGTCYELIQFDYGGKTFDSGNSSLIKECRHDGSLGGNVVVFDVDDLVGVSMDHGNQQCHNP